MNKLVNDILEGKDVRETITSSMKEGIDNDADFLRAKEKLQEIAELGEEILREVREFIRMTRGTRVSEEARLYTEGNLAQFFEDYDDKQNGSIQSLLDGIEEYLDGEDDEE